MKGLPIDYKADSEKRSKVNSKSPNSQECLFWTQLSLSIWIKPNHTHGKKTKKPFFIFVGVTCLGGKPRLPFLHRSSLAHSGRSKSIYRPQGFWVLTKNLQREESRNHPDQMPPQTSHFAAESQTFCTPDWQSSSTISFADTHHPVGNGYGSLLCPGSCAFWVFIHISRPLVRVNA